MPRRDFLQQVLTATKHKLAQGGIEQEYRQVELVGTAPGDAWGQHDAMVAKGLCKAAAAHPDRNRYCNLYPYDSNRVVLSTTPQDTVDYINASLVKLWDREYVLTMAPLDGTGSLSSNSRTSTCKEFWQMVEETESNLIVMLCKVEPGFTGCCQYFPPEEAAVQHHGPYTVALSSTKKVGEGTYLRELLLSREGGGAASTSSSRTVHHLLFTKWPNYGVVDDVTELTQFVKEVLKEDADERRRGPMIIHCSGGIGRSGTFTTIYSLYRLLLNYQHEGDETVSSENITTKQGDLSLLNTVRILREQRHPWMVEGLAQYSLAYSALLHLLRELIDTCPSKENFLTEQFRK